MTKALSIDLWGSGSNGTESSIQATEPVSTLQSEDTGSSCYRPISGSARAYRRGEQPITRLNAVLKAFSDLYPNDQATVASGSRLQASRSAASIIHQRVRYAMGVSPTLCRKRAQAPIAPCQPWLPARPAVQRCAGSACMTSIAAPSCGSVSAYNQPALAARLPRSVKSKRLEEHQVS